MWVKGYPNSDIERDFDVAVDVLKVSDPPVEGKISNAILFQLTGDAFLKKALTPDQRKNPNEVAAAQFFYNLMQNTKINIRFTDGEMRFSLHHPSEGGVKGRVPRDIAFILSEVKGEDNVPMNEPLPKRNLDWKSAIKKWIEDNLKKSPVVRHARRVGEQEEKKKDISNAIDFDVALEKSGFVGQLTMESPVVSFVRYGNDKLRNDLELAEREYRRARAPDKPAAQEKIDEAIKAIEAEQKVIAQKIFFCKNSYSTNRRDMEPHGDGQFRDTLTIALKFNSHQFKKNIVVLPPTFPNIEVRTVNSAPIIFGNGIEISVSGPTDEMSELVYNKGIYQAIVWFTNLRTGDMVLGMGPMSSGIPTADVLKIEIESSEANSEMGGGMVPGMGGGMILGPGAGMGGGMGANPTPPIQRRRGMGM